MPIRHQSGRSDISSDRGHTSPGSYPSTMEAPPSNQDGLHRIQVIQRTQEVFGRTLSTSRAAVVGGFAAGDLANFGLGAGPTKMSSRLILGKGMSCRRYSELWRLLRSASLLSWV